MSPLPGNWRGNRVLASLGSADSSMLGQHLRPVILNARQCLETANRRIETVFFPHSGILSVVARSSNHRHQAEIGLVGHEGMTGLSIVLDAEAPPCSTVVQVEGHGVAVSAEALRGFLQRSCSLRLALLRYVHLFAVQTAHTALANARGTVEQRLARWLLMAHDRLPGNDLQLTHEFLAVVLGVRRAGITIALHRLQSDGLISAARGSIGILDRRGLELSANGFYGAPEREFERVLAP